MENMGLCLFISKACKFFKDPTGIINFQVELDFPAFFSNEGFVFIT